MHVQNRCLIADISCNIHVKDYQLQNTITNFLSFSYLTMWSFKKVRAVTDVFLQISLRNDSANYLMMINQKQYLMNKTILLSTVNY